MRYYAKVVRLRLEVAYVEVEGEDITTGAEAADVVLDESRIEDLDWRLVPFDSEAYAPHVELLVSDQQLTDSDVTPELIRRWMRTSETSPHDRYLLLHADTETGEARTILQPWLSEAAGLTLADLCGEWMDDLADLSELAVQPPQPGTGSATIIPFPGPRRPDDNGGQTLS
jgi:hypothetical protein